MKELSVIPFGPTLKLASIDISNTYTKIHTEDLLNVIDTMWINKTEKTIKLEITEISKLIKVQNCFKSHLQEKGLTMGAPMSFVMSEIYLKFIENTKIYDILRNSCVEG